MRGFSIQKLHRKSQPPSMAIITFSLNVAYFNLGKFFLGQYIEELSSTEFLWIPNLFIDTNSESEAKEIFACKYIKNNGTGWENTLAYCGQVSQDYSFSIFLLWQERQTLKSSILTHAYERWFLHSTLGKQESNNLITCYHSLFSQAF